MNPAVEQATGIAPVENLSMPVPVAYVPVQLVIDGALSTTSENPVQNKVITVAIQNLDGRITAVEGQFSEGVTEAVNNWLAAHPEATTTVQDGAISYAKLDTNLKGEVDQISELKSAFGVAKEYSASNHNKLISALGGNDISDTIPINVYDGGRRNASINQSPQVDGKTISSQIIENIWGSVDLDITFPTGYKGLIVRFYASGDYLGFVPGGGYNSGPLQKTITDPYFCIEIRKTDDSSLTAASFDASSLIVSAGNISNVPMETATQATTIATQANTTANNNTKRVTAVEQNKANIKELDIWGLRKALDGLFNIVALPSLSFLNGFDIPLYSDGYKYKHFADLSKNKNESTNTVTVSNSTELASALSSATSGDTIILNDGVYSAISITKSINLIGEKAVIMPYICGSFSTTAMDNVYKCDMSSSLSGVYDISEIENGIVRKLTSKNNVSALSAEGTYYLSSSGLYVHMFGDKIPTPETVFCDSTSINTISIDSMTENGTVYLEGITVVGGDNNIKCSNGSTYTTQKIIAKDCRFLYANSHNSVTLLGVNGYFQNCEAAYAYYDGFNYHDGNSVHSTGIEIDCTGHDNGHGNTNLSCNGSTVHEGGTIIRIGGIYYNNHGGNVADIQSGTTSYNYDCLAFDSTAPYDTDNGNELYSSADYWAYNSVTMYLYGCRSVGDSQYNLMNASSSLYVDNCEYIRTKGTITPIT